MGYNSLTDQLLDLILQALQGTPVVVPTGMQLNSQTDQLLYQILQVLSGGVAGVMSVTGNIVNNTNPANPVVTQQQADIGETNPASVPFIQGRQTIVRTDGSNDYDNGATQRWPDPAAGAGQQAFVRGSLISVEENVNSKEVAITPYAITVADTNLFTGVQLQEDGDILQVDLVLGANSHVIGDIAIAPAVLDGTQYLQAKLNGNPIKIALIT